MNRTRTAKFQIGQVVKHRLFSFRGVIFDIDPVFNNTEEWWQAIPQEIRPHKDQPFYHLFAENDETNTSPTSPSRTCCRTTPARRSAIRTSPKYSNGTTATTARATAGCIERRCSLPICRHRA